MVRKDLGSDVHERRMGAEQSQDHLAEQPDLVCPECGGAL